MTNNLVANVDKDITPDVNLQNLSHEVLRCVLFMGEIYYGTPNIHEV